MSYVYMKALEKKAEKYDKGIKFLTLGKLPKIKKYIVDNYLNQDDILLDIGMGTGTFAILAAKKGVTVIGIDKSDKILVIAKINLISENLNQKINIIRMPVIDLDEKFTAQSIDKVTAILSFSELYNKEQDFCLNQIFRILQKEGEFILVDEVKPKKLIKRIIVFFIRIPLVLITFLKSHLTTKPLKNIEIRLRNHHFEIIEEKNYLLDSLKLFRLRKSD